MAKNIIEKETYYVCIDIEKTGNVQICGIGMAVGDSKGNVYLKRKWWLLPEGGIKFDPICEKEFWDANPLIKKEMMENTKSQRDQIENFVTVYDSVTNLLNIEESELNLISDNPACDFGELTHLLKKYGKRGALRFTTTGQYRSIVDYGDCMWKLKIGSMINAFADEIQVHDHSPDNDAVHNYIEHLLSLNALETITAVFIEGKETNNETKITGYEQIRLNLKSFIESIVRPVSV